MDTASQQTLARMIRSQRVAALGTLRDGGPLVSMTLYAPAQDFSLFYIHASGLAHHTQDILNDARVSLMIAETDTASLNPQMLARVSIRGEAAAVPQDGTEHEKAKALYLRKFPESAFNFELGDFALYRITPGHVRFVAGFAKAFNLTVEDLKRAAAASV